MVAPAALALHLIVRRHLHGGYSIRRGTQPFGRYDSQGKP
jgi:hypothetical protein